MFANQFTKPCVFKDYINTFVFNVIVSLLKGGCGRGPGSIENITVILGLYALEQQITIHDINQKHI